MNGPPPDRGLEFRSTSSEQSHSVPTGPVRLDDGGYRERSQPSSHQTPESRGDAPVTRAVVPGKLSDGELAQALGHATEFFGMLAHVE